MYLYPIVPFWFASAAYQASLVESKYPWHTDMPPKRTKKVRLRSYRTKIRFILYAKTTFHRVKMCQAFRSPMSICDCLWFENELKMNCLRLQFPSSYLKCPLFFLLWRIWPKNRRMLSFLNCFEDDFCRRQPRVGDATHLVQQPRFWCEI